MVGFLKCRGRTVVCSHGSNACTSHDTLAGVNASVRLHVLLRFTACSAARFGDCAASCIHRNVHSRSVPKQFSPANVFLFFLRGVVLYLFGCGGVIVGTVLDDFSVRYLRGPLLLQRSRQTHPKLMEKDNQCCLGFNQMSWLPSPPPLLLINGSLASRCAAPLTCGLML